MDPLYDAHGPFRHGYPADCAGVRGAECYNRNVRRFALALIVALLAFSASGVPSLSLDEPCVGTIAGVPDDGACPPSCVTCGCCAQGAEAPVVALPGAQDAPVEPINSIVPRIPQTPTAKILHVPKPFLA